MELKKRKSCVIVTSFAEKQPGFLDFSYRVQSLAKNYDVTVVSQDKLTQPELITKSEYVVIGRYKGGIGLIRYLSKAASCIKKINPDVVVLLHSKLAPLTLFVRNIPVCLYWNEHPTNLFRISDSSSPLRKLSARLFQWLSFFGAKKAKLILPIGEETYDEFVRLGVNAENLYLNYMGVDDQFAKVSNLKQSNTHDIVKLIYVGTVSKLRGRDVMLEAMAGVAQNGGGAHLTIIGASDEQLSYCADKILELGITNYVSVEGRISGDSIPSRLADADIGICLWEDLPWWRYNPPTKLFEYLVAGLPALVSDIRTHTRYITDWNNGFIFQYNADALADTIIKIVERKEHLGAVKSNARQSGQNYLWSKLEPEFLDAIAKSCL